VSPSGAGYRLRTRLHVAGRGRDARVGYFAPRSHRVVDASACEAIAAPTREASLSAIREAIAGAGTRAFEAAILEDIAGRRRLLRVTAAASPGETAELTQRLEDRFDGVRIRSPDGPILRDGGAERLDIDIGHRRLLVSVDSFFQGNRHLVSELVFDVEREARRVRAGEALDAFGGTGLFAGALLSAGHRVTSVELDLGAIADARETRETWPDRDRWGIEAASIADFLRADEREFDLVVVDPPRTGLGAELAAELARRTRRLLLYVSCDPATLARDLDAIRAARFEIRSTRLYDLFAFTHRIEAFVALERLA
jgi:23S rRNA (uracil1939-C5)-methyltransferase